MMTERPFWIVNETRVGHTGLHPGFDLEQPIAPIEESLERNLCNGFRIWHWPPTRELMEQIINEAGFLAVDFWIGCSLQRHWIKESGKSEEDFYAYHVDMLKEAARKYGDRFFWTITGEPDSQAPNWPVEQFKSKQEAREAFVDWVKYFTPAMDPHTRFRWHSFLKSRKVDLAKHQVAIHLGFPMSAHYAYELGVRLVWVECNCQLVEGVQVTAAFARGAANQFRKSKTYWGLDFSCWNDPSGLATSYDEQGRRIGGCTESLLLREWMYAFLSGANLLHEEISDRSHWLWHPKPYAKLSKLGKMASRFGKFAMSFDRGEPYRSVGVMLEHDHGWQSALDDAGGNQVWFGTVPAGNADLTIGHFFDLAFPGHADGLKGYGELYDQDPWRTQAEFREKITSGKDMRPYEHGRLATSRWGDVIDVVLANCPQDVLADYKVLVILGDLTIKDDLAKKLKRYVKAGGTLIANVTHFFDCPPEQLQNHVSHGTQGRAWAVPSVRDGTIVADVERFLGFKFTGVKLKGSSSFCCQCDTAMPEEGFLVENIELNDATPIATIPRYLYPPDPDTPIERTPLVVQRDHGRGRVITTLAYHMMHPIFRTPLRISEHVYDHVIRETLPLKVEGRPIQYLFNRMDRGWVVSLFNNSNKHWKGCLIGHGPRSVDYAWGRAGEVKRLRNKGQWKLQLDVPKYDSRVLTLYE